MTISAGNWILIIGLLLAGGVMLWQFFNTESPSSDESDWHDDVEQSEEKLDETEEMLRRMERLSKREDDDRKKK